jgi:sulfoxide reductase heme-binding subunit YedZ
VTVLLGLALAAKTLRAPRLKRATVELHEHLALVALAAIGVHGLSLLGDRWLKPGLAGIAVPFALSYRPTTTALGIIAGYVAVILGPSFYLRRRIGARRWRKLHRATVVVWLLSAIHALGSGTDSRTLWLRCLVLAPIVPIAYLVMLRLMRSPAPPRAPAHVPVSDPGCDAPVRSEYPQSHSAPIATPAAARAVAIIPTSGSVSA